MRLPYLREGVQDELGLEPETEALAVVVAHRVQAASARARRSRRAATVWRWA